MEIFSSIGNESIAATAFVVAVFSLLAAKDVKLIKLSFYLFILYIISSFVSHTSVSVFGNNKFHFLRLVCLELLFAYSVSKADHIASKGIAGLSLINATNHLAAFGAYYFSWLLPIWIAWDPIVVIIESLQLLIVVLFIIHDIKNNYNNTGRHKHA